MTSPIAFSIPLSSTLVTLIWYFSDLSTTDTTGRLLSSAASSPILLDAAVILSTIILWTTVRFSLVSASFSSCYPSNRCKLLRNTTSQLYGGTTSYSLNLNLSEYISIEHAMVAAHTLPYKQTSLENNEHCASAKTNFQF